VSELCYSNIVRPGHDVVGNGLDEAGSRDTP